MAITISVTTKRLTIPLTHRPKLGRKTMAQLYWQKNISAV